MVYRVHGHCDSASADFDRVHTNESSTKDLAGKILCCGVGSVVAIQSFLNICVATGLAPNTGTPLPFVSYGLTSLISLFIGMGLVMNVGLQSSAYNKELKKKEIDKKEEYL